MNHLNKRQKQLLVILTVAAVVFSVIVFLIPFPKKAVFWIAWLFEMIAFALQIPIFKLAFDNAEELKSKVLGFPVFRVGYLYLGIQTVLSLALFALGFIPKFPLWLTLVLCILVLAGAIVCSMTADIARDEVQRVEFEQKKDTSAMTSLKSISASLIPLTSDVALQKQLEQLAEDFRYSDPVSSDALTTVETELSSMLNQLQNHLEQNTATSEEITALQKKLAQRNALCKANKAK
ncbi:MAG: hypothetical protein IKP69_10190 [Oscillospiraceae bacterium]|nr:hypothetical protein [Oscillospiraceae bacterium]